MKKRHYSIAERIEGNEPLVQLLNGILDKTEILRIISSPSSTANYNHIKNEIIYSFYQCCMLETYLHSAVEHLRRWKKDAEKYNNEFQGSWKYYAIADRLECIKQWGGDEDDYNPDGSIREKVSDKQLKGSSLLESWRGYNDIFLTSKLKNFDYISSVIQNQAKFSISSVFRELGKPLNTYKDDGKGNMIAQDWADEQLDQAKNQYVADGVVDFLTLFVKNCRTIIDQVEKLPYNKDHKEFFATLPDRIDAIFQLKLNAL